MKVVIGILLVLAYLVVGVLIAVPYNWLGQGNWMTFLLHGLGWSGCCRILALGIQRTPNGVFDSRSRSCLGLSCHSFSLDYLVF